MFVTLAITLSFTLLSLAQSPNNTQVDLEAIEAHFNNSGIVPNLIKQFSPSALLSVKYRVGSVQPGQKLTVDDVKLTPELFVTPSNSSVNFSGNYTLTMVDAGIVDADESKGQTRHWLANSVMVSGTKLVFTNASNITDYAGPLPPSGSGPHRYVIILYSQPPSFAPPDGLARPGQPVEVFKLNQYVSSSGLGPIVAATYYTVEQGTASSSISATSAVVTSTLPAAKFGSATNSASTPSKSAGGKSNSASSIHNIKPGFAGLLGVLGIFLVA